ncbi:MAG TPA: hypothetical protein VLS93_01750 [Anaeromyxobacteraceae bacterium]|nr:hypothetical protein [Anaeromyxobacteraceae bacterium]
MARAHLIAAALLLAACPAGREEGAGKAGRGRLVAAGEVRAVAADPGGAWLAWLEGCREATGQYLPPRTANCDLRVAPAGGGDARLVGRGVTTLPHGFVWSREGSALAVLAGYDYAAGTGTLLAFRGGTVEEVAKDVAFHGFAPGGALAGVARGRLVLAPPGAPRSLRGVESLATFEFDPAPGGRRRGEVAALLRTRAAAGGALLALLAETDEVVRIGEDVADYGFAPAGGTYAFVSLRGGAHELRVGRGRSSALAGSGASGFAFARDGSALAWLGEVEPGKQGNLHVARVGAPGRVLAREVGEYRWAAGAPRIAWLQGYDPRVRAGTLAAGGLDEGARTVAPNVTDFALSPDGRRVAFLQHTARGGYSVDLGLAALDAPPDAKPSQIAQGVFGFDFSPDGRWLYYRTRCTRNGEACDLERIPAEGLAAGGKPAQIARGVKSFEFDPADPGRLLLGFQRMDMPALDVAIWREDGLVAVDQAVVPGTARFLGPRSERLVYAVMHPKRAGAYVAELPR